MAHNVLVARELLNFADEVATEISARVWNDREARDNFTRDAVETVMSESKGKYWCVICAKHGELKGSQKDLVHTRTVYLRYQGGGAERFELWMVPTGVKVNFIRTCDGGWINWAVQGQHERGDKKSRHEAHIWVPDWASKPWE